MMKNKKVFIFGIVSLALLGLVSAGVGSLYSENNPLRMNYGETRTIYFNLQNIGDEDVNYKIELKEGQDIATLEETDYLIMAGTTDTQVPLTITIPKDYSQQTKRIDLMFNVLKPEQEGMVSLTTGYTISFEVILSQGEVKKAPSSWILILLIGIIIVLGLIIYVFMSKRK